MNPETMTSPTPDPTQSPGAQSSSIALHAKLRRPGFYLDVDLQLPARGVSVILGPSGSGKTSCLRILAGLEPAATGRVSVAGELWQDSAQGMLRPAHQRAVGYVFQEASLLAHLSVQANLRFGYNRTPAAERRHGWDHGLELLGIGHLLARMPHTLSGGERQRVAIARALASSPRVLLMDEPLAALDAQRKDDILPWLEQLHAQLDIPVVYVTHSPDELARLGDYAVLLDNGSVRASGPVLDLMTRLDLPLAHGDAAATLLLAQVGSNTPDPSLCELCFAGGSLVLPQTRSTPLPAHTPVRVRIQARDVSISLVMPELTSVLNILPAIVLELAKDGPGQMLVRLQIGAHNGSDTAPQAAPQTARHTALKTVAPLLLARISQLSARRLGLVPGMAVYAQVKGVAMVR